ncbi:MAG: hypothetical protein ABJQ70_21015 [Roseobacter sp.]
MVSINDAKFDGTTSKNEGVLRIATIGNLAVAHWAVYWVMNGLDKFLNRTDLGLFTWYGKDRSQQFGNYLSNTDMPAGMLNGLLYVTGVIELLVALPLFYALIAVVSGVSVSRRAFELGFLLSAAIFSGFSFFDVIIGDRAELWEHGTFLIGLLLCYKLAKEEYESAGHFD